MSDSNFDGVLDPDAGWPDIPQASTQFVVLGGQGGPLNEQAMALAARTKKLKSDMDNFSDTAAGGKYKKLDVTVSGVGYQGTITASMLVVESVDGKSKVLRNVNLLFNGANAGSNGLDVNVITAGNWYYLFVIYNQTTDTTASLVSLSATSPTLPNGYTHFLRVGAARVQAAATKFTAQEQKDNEVTFGVGSQEPVTLVSGGTNTTATAVATITAAPPTAVAILASAQATSGACSIYTDFVNGLPYLSGSPNLVTSGYIPFKVANSITYRMVQDGTGYVRAYGYKDRL